MLYLTTFVTTDEAAWPYLGDTGGPALLDSADQMQVAGLVSYFADGGRLQVTVSTRVSTYAGFIADVMDSNPPPSGVPASSEQGLRLRAAPNPFNPMTEISFELEEEGG